MTRIDFHTNIPDKLSYVCRLARKAYAARAKLVLLADSPAQAEALNEALWTLSGTDFIPHVMAGDPLAPETPVIVTADENAELPHRDMLVNLTRRTPAGFEQFVVDLSEPEPAPGVTPAPPDMGRLVATAAKYGIDILGPLPE